VVDLRVQPPPAVGLCGRQRPDDQLGVSLAVQDEQERAIESTATRLPANATWPASAENVRICDPTLGATPVPVPAMARALPT
jgi:hypothetical protein